MPYRHKGAILAPVVRRNTHYNMQQPQGFFTNPSLVCRLKKSLYGIKQAPRAWYAKIDGFLLSLSFVQCKYDPNVYLKLVIS